MEGQYPGRVRLTDFWARMRAQFGDVYAQSVAKDYVFDKLGDRTIERDRACQEAIAGAEAETASRSSPE